MPKRKSTRQQPDRLLNELDRCERQLKQWIKSSSRNAQYYRRDPLGAMHAAGLDIDDDLMMELELIAAAIARKLK